MCAIIAQFIRDLLDFAGLSRAPAYITSVFTLPLSAIDSIGSLIKRFAAKKAGVEDGEINNNVRRSSICWRGRRESDIDAQKRNQVVMTSL